MFKFISSQPVKHFLLRLLPSLRTKKKLVRTVVQKQQPGMVNNTRKDAQLGPSIALVDWISQQTPRTYALYFFLFFSNYVWNITLPSFLTTVIELITPVKWLLFFYEQNPLFIQLIHTNLCYVPQQWTNFLKWTTKNFFHTMAFTTSFEITIPLKRQILTTKSGSVEAWRQSLPWSKIVSLKHHLLGHRNVSFCRSCGGRKRCSQSKTFCAGTITKTLSQHWMLCRKMSSCITTKVLIWSSLDKFCLTWPTFVFTVLPVQIFICS